MCLKFSSNSMYKSMFTPQNDTQDCFYKNWPDLYKFCRVVGMCWVLQQQKGDYAGECCHGNRFINLHVLQFSF